MKPVSSIAATLVVLLVFLLNGVRAQQSPIDPQKSFAAGEAALRAGKLDLAEHQFRQVLAANPDVAGAYANLGVIHMRRKQWPQALSDLQRAERLAPEIAGIRLNIGLVYFRTNDFTAAIPSFESVVKQAPDSFQARYLLGLCYFFNDRWADAIGALEPLWDKASSQLNYLYVLDIAAYKAKSQALEDKAGTRLVEVGAGSPEFHLLMGKAHLNRGEFDDAVKELEAAAKGDPKLPFVHFNLGLAYARKENWERARSEFLKDIAVDSDTPFSYEQLANVDASTGDDEEAIKNYRSALKFSPQLVSARMGIAKIEERRKRYTSALAELDQVMKIDGGNASAHYMRGQVLVRMGRDKEGREVLAASAKLLNEQRAARHKELEGDAIPSPELAREPE